MVSNISFGSTYKVSSLNNGYEKCLDFQSQAQRFCDRYYDSACSTKYTANKSDIPYSVSYMTDTTLVVPDNIDNKVELYCANHGIQYRKYDTAFLTDPKLVKLRIKHPERNLRQTNVNVDKLEKLISNQHTNLSHCESDYNKYYKPTVDFMIKSADEIPASVLSILPTDFMMSDTIRYIQRYGAENLNPGQLMVDFTQAADAPDHCVYFALRDMGLKNVPVYVDDNTFKIGSALGIFA